MDQILQGKSLIYSAPTSAGKTLVSDIIMIRHLLKNPSKKVLMIFPFVSLIVEKSNKLKTLFEFMKVNFIQVHSGKFFKYDWETTNVVLCTIEKANSLINRLIENDELSDIGLIVIDEFHMIGNAQRGFLVETLLTKILYINERKRDLNHGFNSQL